MEPLIQSSPENETYTEGHLFLYISWDMAFDLNETKCFLNQGLFPAN